MFKLIAFRSKSKDWLVWSQNNMSGYSDMSSCKLLPFDLARKNIWAVIHMTLIFSQNDMHNIIFATGH